ncbi:MmyB family transcriptional regulator [Streptomyces coeruleorubidus]|uniref:MmyB family transcriptional regulator n=1 Tax=Streptomyces coeruleorubidus TaxID=116188 RepID=UPI003F53A9B4
MKLLHHPVVGDLDLPFETFPLGDGPSQFLLTYTAEPASPSQDALNLLASWAAANDDIERSAPAGDSEQDT